MNQAKKQLQVESDTPWKVSRFGNVWYVFSRIQTEYPNSLRKSLYLVQMRENT